MKRAVPILLLVVALVTAGGVTFSAAGAAAAPPPRQVTIVLAPYLIWSDITPALTPVLWRLVGSGAVGNVGARSRVPEAGEPPSPLEGALTLSAGNWATPDYAAPAAFNATETFGPLTAAEAFALRTGHRMGWSAIAYLGLPEALRANAPSAGDTVLGTLGAAVRSAGGSTAAVGNSDSGETTGPIKFMRPAGVGAMDASGLVDFGDVSRDVLASTPGAPYGYATSVPALRTALENVRSRVASSPGPALLVIDPGDSYRARRFAPQADSIVRREQRDAALKELDRVVGVAEAQQPSGGVLIVVTQGLLVDSSGAPEGFGPLIVSGEGWHGYLTSGSTHRAGMGTELDVTATALNAMGLGRPVQVAGNALTVVPAPSDTANRIGYLTSLDRVAIAVDSWRAFVVDWFLVAVGVCFALSGLLFALQGRLGRRLGSFGSTVGRLLVLFLASVPVASWLIFLVTPYPTRGASAVLLGAGIALAIVLAAFALAACANGRAAPAAVALLTVAVLLTDQWLGAPLSFTGFFSYSPLGSARFYGMGNEAAALAVGAAMLGMALVLDQWPEERWSPSARRIGVAAVGILVVVTAAAPSWGANVGVAVWGTIGFAVAWVLMNGRRFTWKSALIAVLLTVPLIGGFAVIDLLGHGEQTHLGRSLVSAAQGGPHELWLIAVRKAQTNARVLSHTNWSWLLVATLALFAFLRIAFRDRFSRLLAENPQFERGMIAATVAGVLAFLTEDSGIVIPSLISLYIGVGLAWLALTASQRREDS
jgi:hypothetical protein